TDALPALHSLPTRRSSDLDHVTTFNMAEWADRRGNSMPGDQPGGFEYTMNQVLFDPIGRSNTVPQKQRNFATKQNLPTYAGKIRSEEHTSELQSHLNLVCR